MVRSLIVRAVWFPHQVVVMANRNIFCALLVLLRVGQARAGSCIDEVVVGRVEAITPVQHSLALTLGTHLAINTLICISWVALALSLHLLCILKMRCT